MGDSLSCKTSVQPLSQPKLNISAKTNQENLYLKILFDQCSCCNRREWVLLRMLDRPDRSSTVRTLREGWPLLLLNRYVVKPYGLVVDVPNPWCRTWHCCLTAAFPRALKSILVPGISFRGGEISLPKSPSNPKIQEQKVKQDIYVNKSILLLKFHLIVQVKVIEKKTSFSIDYSRNSLAIVALGPIP